MNGSGLVNDDIKLVKILFSDMIVVYRSAIVCQLFINVPHLRRFG
jgi:hypothetical protein